MPNKTELPPLLDLSEFDESINWCVYGDSGVGKTVLGGTLPNAMFLSTEPGTISAKRQGSTAKVRQIKNWEQLRAAYAWLRKGDHGFDWVVMDSATSMQHLALRAILDAAVADNPARDLDIPAIQDHQKWQNMFKRFVNMFNDLPVNVLWTATTMRKEDEEGDDIILPDIQGKGYGMSQFFCATMHLVTYLSVQAEGKGKDRTKFRRLLAETDPPYFGKDRYNVLIPYVDYQDGDKTIGADLYQRILDSGEAQEQESAKPAARKATARKTAAAVKAPAKAATRRAAPAAEEPDPDEEGD
jgi:hypothetical protein